MPLSLLRWLKSTAIPSPVLQLWHFQPTIHFRSGKQRTSLRSAAVFPQQEQVQTGQDLSQINKICPKLFCPGEERSLQHEACSSWSQFPKVPFEGPHHHVQLGQAHH